MPQPPAAPLPASPPTQVAKRIGHLRAPLADAGCDALLVTKLENVRYLTGFTGSAAVLLVGPSSAAVYTDGRYRDQMTDELAAGGVELELTVGIPAEQREAQRRALRGTKLLGLEAEVVSWAMKRRLASDLGAGELMATSGLVESLREVKDAGEIARIEKAASIADVALAQVKQRLVDGVTERELAAELEFEMRRRGADGPSFDTIIAAGPNAAMPHAQPTGRRILPGELVVLDFGALVDGYHSDMTRTLCVGPPSGRGGEVVEAVLASQRAGLHAVRAGARACDVDAACRRTLADAGFEKYFVHGTGHGVGLEIHERPALGQGSADILSAGAVVTVEPGVYMSGVGGARIEDTVVVGDDGPRGLTLSTKDLTL